MKHGRSCDIEIWRAARWTMSHWGCALVRHFPITFQHRTHYSASSVWWWWRWWRWESGGDWVVGSVVVWGRHELQDCRTAGRRRSVCPVNETASPAHDLTLPHTYLPVFIFCLFVILYSPISYTHTHPFNDPLSGTTRVSRYQKGKTNLDFTEARDSEWQWHQLGRMQVCTSLQTDNHASTPPLGFFSQTQR